MKYFFAIACLFFALFFSAGVSAQTTVAKHRPTTTIDHVALFVVDLPKEQSFYRDIIQLDSLAEPFHDNKHAWFTIGNGIALHLIQGAPQTKEYYKNNHICFSVPSLSDFTQLLLARQIAFEDVSGKPNAITTRVDGVHQIWLRDPEGYWLELNDAQH